MRNPPAISTSRTARRPSGGSSDRKTLTQRADSLLQSIQGVEDAPRSAALAAQTHRQMTLAERQALRAVWREVARAGRGMRALVDATPRDRRAKRRSQTIISSAVRCMFTAVGRLIAWLPGDQCGRVNGDSERRLAGGLRVADVRLGGSLWPVTVSGSRCLPFYCSPRSAVAIRKRVVYCLRGGRAR